MTAVWITGATRSGKTQALVARFARSVALSGAKGASDPGVLVLAAIGENRLALMQRLTAATEARQPFRATTPLGFLEDEVNLFWALLVAKCDFKAQFPLRLRPETEQALATALWRPDLDRAVAAGGIPELRLVRRILDLMQLAALAGTPLGDVPVMLAQGLGPESLELAIPYERVGQMLAEWRDWCLARGLLTYSLYAQLYAQELLPDRTYQARLLERYPSLYADDVDEYPAILRPLFEHLLDGGVTATFTFNPNGAVRQGLGADPLDLGRIADRCEIIDLEAPTDTLVATLGQPMIQLITDPIYFPTLPDSIQSIQATTRAELLRQTAATIIHAVQSGQVAPQDIAIIGPGLDAIARYALTEILGRQQIPVHLLNDQRPLSSTPLIRALLTLLALVYPQLGRLVNHDAVAEMLVVLGGRRVQPGGEVVFAIDPARSGLLADHCFEPHPDRPRLLPATVFPRWDRLGFAAVEAYNRLAYWIDQQRSQLEQRLITSPVVLLDRAIQRFCLGAGEESASPTPDLPFDQVAALRELMETAQHYWDLEARLRQIDRADGPPSMAVSRFIQLLRGGAVTANPFPVQPIGIANQAITLSTVFQYRASRRHHRWQFWFDAGTPRWLTGVDSLYAAPLFLSSWSGRQWNVDDQIAANEQRLQRILLDLLGRVSDQVFLCCGDLATNGQEQLGILLPLVQAAKPWALEVGADR
jgi:hypothetical protein